MDGQQLWVEARLCADTDEMRAPLLRYDAIGWNLSNDDVVRFMEDSGSQRFHIVLADGGLE